MIQINKSRIDKLTLHSGINTDIQTFYDQGTVLGSYASTDKIVESVNVVYKDETLENYIVHPLCLFCHHLNPECCWS